MVGKIGRTHTTARPQARMTSQNPKCPLTSLKNLEFLQKSPIAPFALEIFNKKNFLSVESINYLKL
jgi:hypothetical protein